MIFNFFALFDPWVSLLSGENVRSTIILHKVPPPGEPGSSSGGRNNYSLLDPSIVRPNFEEVTRPPRVTLCGVRAHKRVRRLKESPIGQTLSIT
jgi:hypothetical protein